jgi:nitronate monooxygenase/enoyl-[acyl-carrier protein] reductase II
LGFSTSSSTTTSSVRYTVRSGIRATWYFEEAPMLHTPFCERFGIDVPVVQAAIAPYTSAELVAAVSNAGGLGTLGSAMRPVNWLREEIARTRALTARPFSVNFTLASFDPEALEVALRSRPAVISTALGDPGDLVARAHDAGALVIHQVHTVSQALRAAELGIDAIVAQGSEAGGFTGAVATLPLVPQVVDAVRPLPVLAAGGIADGRGLAAALVLGAQGVNIGTRFLTARESLMAEAGKQQLLGVRSEETLKLEFVNDIFPKPPGSYDTSPRSYPTPFIADWLDRRDDARREAPQLEAQIRTAIREDCLHELVHFAGQSAGLLRDVLPAAEIVRRLVAEAREALRTSERV